MFPDQRMEAFHRLYQAHYRKVAAYARRRLNQQDADDAVAETFLVAWRRLEDIPEGDLTLPWLYVVARRVVSQDGRSRRRRDRLLARVARFRPPVNLEFSETDHFDEQQAVHVALKKLRPEDQELLRLAEWEELAPAQLARVYACSTNAITIRLHRARKRFAEALRSVEAETESVPERRASS
jgi:RNA polymerase sigma-70 factor, ECF subfamily